MTPPLLHELIAGVAGSAVSVQRQLDGEFLNRLHETVPLLTLGSALGISREFSPAELAITEVEAELTLEATRTRETEFSLTFRIVNAGYFRKYTSREFRQQKLRVFVRRVPVSPGTFEEALSSPP